MIFTVELIIKGGGGKQEMNVVTTKTVIDKKTARKLIFEQYKIKDSEIMAICSIKKS